MFVIRFNSAHINQIMRATIQFMK